jgi:subtilisin family serine protease
MTDLFDWNCPDADCLEVRNSFLRAEELSTRLDSSQQFISAATMPSELAIEPMVDQSSEQMTVGDLGSNDLAPQGALPAGMVTKEAAQRKYLVKFGKSIAWEGRTLEVLEAGDRRLAGVTTAYEGGFYVIDPQFMAGMGLKDVPRYISEEEIVSPPSKRLVTMEQLLKNSPPFKGGENLPDFWTKPGAPIVEPRSNFVQDTRPLIPKDEASLDKVISVTIDNASTVKIGVSNYSLADLKNRDVLAERLTREEMNRRGLVPTLSFPAQDQIVGVVAFGAQRSLLLRNASTGEMQTWSLDPSYTPNGSNKFGELPLGYASLSSTPPGNWVIEGVGKFNNDSVPDIVWRNLGAGGETAFWFIDTNNAATGAASASGLAPSNIPANWRIEGVADMNNDGKDDLIWRDYSGGGSFIWYMNGTALISTSQIAASTSIPTAWKITGVADFNSDGVKDIFWNNPSTGETAYWQMASGYGSITSGQFMLTTPIGWVAETIGSVGGAGSGGNNIVDIIWKAPDGSHWFWDLGVGSNGLPSIANGFRLHTNSTSTTNTFNSNGFHSEFGYGMVNTSAAIAYLKNQAAPLEVPDQRLYNAGFDSTRQNEILNLPEAWAQGFTGQGVTVAVIDSGVALNHPAFNGQLWTNSADPIDGVDNDGNGLADDFFGWDFNDNDNNPSPDGYVVGSHGTKVAGTIIAKSTLPSNVPAILGGAYGSKVMALRAGSSVLNTQTNKYESVINLTAAASAITYAANKGAKVINLSFGTFSPTASQITTLNAAINYAVSQGAVIVIASGDEAGNATIDNVYPAVLAGTPGVIAVGSVNAGNIGQSANNQASQVSSFSTGAGVVTRNYVMAPGQNISTTSRGVNGQNTQLVTPNTFTWTYDELGTSYAAPLVSSAVAIIKQAVPNATPAQIVNAITQTADSSDIYL